MLPLVLSDMLIATLVHTVLKLLYDCQSEGLPRWVLVASVPCLLLAVALVVQSTERGHTVAGASIMLATVVGAAPSCRRIFSDAM